MCVCALYKYMVGMWLYVVFVKWMDWFIQTNKFKQTEVKHVESNQPFSSSTSNKWTVTIQEGKGDKLNPYIMIFDAIDSDDDSKSPFKGGLNCL